MTRVGALRARSLLLLFIKFVAHVGSFGWGFFVDMILALVVAAGAWFIAQGKSTPLDRSTHAPDTRVRAPRDRARRLGPS